MLQGVVIRVLVMAVSNNWVWEQPPLPVPFPHEYIVDVPTAYVRGAAVEFYPVVMMHGMNDAGHTGHMERMRLVVSDTLDGAYVTSVQIGRNVREDEYNSVHLTMDEQVSRFAAIVRRDPNLRHGFHAIGFSQGGLIVRGYIERYNNPPVIGFLACHSPLAGIGSLPICNPTTFFCRQLNKFFGAFAYSSELQHQLAQSNFYRDPTRIPEYRERVKYLPDLNNELSVQNATYKANFASLRQLIMVRALRDTQIAPTMSSWFGAYEDGGWDTILPMNETSWYQSDTFGLKTLHTTGRVTLYETPDNHLQFTDELLATWVRTHFRPPSMHRTPVDGKI
ncbi:hypothetical protein, variant 1 [Aphanomyces invadans]|uniref:Palmitoyl-protein thioesterase 1 n=1 Tax=Aphanomyces invadans TaxID=157072 RepID=A0A024TU40_9STRA|nr:hypothetical protein, variant 1 [Aphanomyces invadans]ETV97499.1 hypothetical protein, variant 1 [Aphanomyces invadans]|eukprot:XP_008873709.1 hypothetical protein, variant 1 [Aphanomyces invadans]